MNALPYLIAVVGTIGTYLVNNVYETSRGIREKKLIRINAQLKHLYGPLLAILRTGKEAFGSFLQMRLHGPDGKELSPGERYAVLLRTIQADSNCELAKDYRLLQMKWLLPLNEKAADIIVNNADLISEPQVPVTFLQLCAHVASMRMLTKKWEENDYRNMFSLIPFPYEIQEELKDHFKELKIEQIYHLKETSHICVSTDEKGNSRGCICYRLFCCCLKPGTSCCRCCKKVDGVGDGFRYQALDGGPRTSETPEYEPNSDSVRTSLFQGKSVKLRSPTPKADRGALDDHSASASPFENGLDRSLRTSVRVLPQTKMNNIRARTSANERVSDPFAPTTRVVQRPQSLVELNRGKQTHTERPLLRRAATVPAAPGHHPATRYGPQPPPKRRVGATCALPAEKVAFLADTLAVCEE